MAVIIRLLQDSEKELVNNFFNDIYKTNRPLKNFEWEFFEGPFGKAIYVVAIDDSVTTTIKVVGIQCAIPIEMLGSCGEIVLTAKSEDTLVDPAYRGQKIFERMYDLLFAESRKVGIKYIWGFTPANKAFERLGFEIPFKAEQALLVIKPLASFSYLKKLNAQNKFADKLKIFGLVVLSWLRGLNSIFFSTSALRESSLTAQDVAFKAAFSGSNYFSLNETDAYLTWRLKNNPFNNNYRSFKAVNQQTKLDLLINFRKDVAYVEQLIAKPHTSIKAELKSMIKIFRQHDAALIRAFTFRSNEILIEQGNALKEAGFTYLTRGSYFVWKALDDKNAIDSRQLLINRLFTQGNL